MQRAAGVAKYTNERERIERSEPSALQGRCVP
nr:MAG TPA: hypothetical protein [Microviridae sp.]